MRTRFGRVELPEGALKAMVDDFSSSDFLPVIEVILAGKSDYAALNHYALRLKEQIRRVSEVNSVTLVGSREREVIVELRGEALEALGLSAGEVTTALSRQNLTIPGGTLKTANREYLVRTLGNLESVQDFEGVIVRRGSSGGVVRIRDVAQVIEGFDHRGILARYNGEPSIALRVAKVPRGNSVKVIAEVKRVSEAFGKNLPPELKLALFNDSTVQIKKSLSILVANALWGMIFLVVILFLFVGLRNALMTGLGIPITFGVTFLILELTGETFNTNTLFGLVLVLGLIVDHAIVITENSFRLQQGGLSRREAAIKGTDQVVLPVIAATATTVAAFLPLMILPGTLGKFLRVIPFTVAAALLASTAEAVIFLPSHYADWPGGRKKRSERFFLRFQKLYGRVLDRVYRRRGLTVLLLFIFMAGVFGLVGTLDQDLFSAEDYTYFTIDIELPPGSPLNRTLEAVEDFEERLLPLVGNGEVVSLLSAVGFSGGQQGKY